MKYFLTIKFEDACLCITKSKKITDYVNDSFSIEKWINRQEHNLSKDSILSVFDDNICDKLFKIEPISNMLHVLCGERPVPSFKNTLRKRYIILDEIAKNCFYKIDNVYLVTDKNNVKKPITDFTQGKKWVGNANVKNGLKTLTKDGLVFQGDITWATLKQRYYYCNKEKYDNIISHFKEWFGCDDINFFKEYTLIDFLLFLSEEKNKKNEMITFFQNEKMTTFIHVINRNLKATNSFNMATENMNNLNLARRVVNYSPVFKLYLNGCFIFQIEDEDIVRAILNGNRHATYLENGYAKLISINDSIDEDALNINGFKKISKV